MSKQPIEGDIVTYSAVCPSCFGKRSLRSVYVKDSETGKLISRSISKPCRGCGYGTDNSKVQQ